MHFPGDMDETPLENQQLKRCGRCGKTKPRDAFAFRNEARRWRQSWCRACMAAYQRTRGAS